MVDVDCFVLLALWITGDMFKIDATITAFIGLSLLLLTSELTWEDIKGEKSAWDTIVWFAVLVMMASSLNDSGFIGWFSELISVRIKL